MLLVRHRTNGSYREWLVLCTLGEPKVFIFKWGLIYALDTEKAFFRRMIGSVGRLPTP